MSTPRKARKPPDFNKIHAKMFAQTASIADANRRSGKALSKSPSPPSTPSSTLQDGSSRSAKLSPSSASSEPPPTGSDSKQGDIVAAAPPQSPPHNEISSSLTRPCSNDKSSVSPSPSASTAQRSSREPKKIDQLRWEKKSAAKHRLRPGRRSRSPSPLASRKGVSEYSMPGVGDVEAMDLKTERAISDKPMGGRIGNIYKHVVRQVRRRSSEFDESPLPSPSAPHSRVMGSLTAPSRNRRKRNPNVVEVAIKACARVIDVLSSPPPSTSGSKLSALPSSYKPLDLCLNVKANANQTVAQFLYDLRESSLRHMAVLPTTLTVGVGDGALYAFRAVESEWFVTVPRTSNWESSFTSTSLPPRTPPDATLRDIYAQTAEAESTVDTAGKTISEAVDVDLQLVLVAEYGPLWFAVDKLQHEMNAAVFDLSAVEDEHQVTCETISELEGKLRDGEEIISVTKNELLESRPHKADIQEALSQGSLPRCSPDVHDFVHLLARLFGIPTTGRIPQRLLAMPNLSNWIDSVLNNKISKEMESVLREILVRNDMSVSRLLEHSEGASRLCRWCKALAVHHETKKSLSIIKTRIEESQQFKLVFVKSLHEKLSRLFRLEISINMLMSSDKKLTFEDILVSQREGAILTLQRFLLFVQKVRSNFSSPESVSSSDTPQPQPSPSSPVPETISSLTGGIELYPSTSPAWLSVINLLRQNAQLLETDAVRVLGSELGRHSDKDRLRPPPPTSPLPQTPSASSVAATSSVTETSLDLGISLEERISKRASLYVDARETDADGASTHSETHTPGEHAKANRELGVALIRSAIDNALEDIRVGGERIAERGVDEGIRFWLDALSSIELGYHALRTTKSKSTG